MPYIVPSISGSAPSTTVTPPHSPSRPPMVLTLALAGPAPVPPQTPFTPPTLATSPPLTESSASDSQSFGSAAKGMRHLYSPQKPLPLVKALSDSNAQATTNSPSPSESKGSPSSSRSPPMRRAVSASSASPKHSTYRHTNTAGSSLPHIPRRRTGSGMSLHVEQTDQSSAQAQITPRRGRSRSRFVLGSEEESASASDEEQKMQKVKEGRRRNSRETGQDVEERVIRKRPISADRSSSLKTISPPFSRFPISAAASSVDTESDTDGSDCATPTQTRIAHVHRVHDRTVELEPATEFKSTKSSGSGESGMSAIALKARKGRRRDGARRPMFEVNSEDESDQPSCETSTIAFPLSNPPSPPPCIEVNTPTPEMTPYSSPRQEDNSKSLSEKRRNAGSLRLDFSFGGGPAEASGSVDGNSTPAEHGRTLSESASLNSMQLIRKKSGEIVRPSLKSRSSSASSARQRPSLSLGDISSFAVGSPSVSAPTTPAISAKMVHFDKQLEHVKVFRSTSRPVAVSRDGSPTYDDTTSGGEYDSASDGPSLADFIPRPRPKRLVPGGTTHEEEDAVRRVLMMRVLNMPHRDANADDADVRLEHLHLADDAAIVQGIVRVRNIAFEKHVAVRFTFDGWQTTSEVLGRWSESCVPRNAAPSSLPVRSRAVSNPVAGAKADEPPKPTFDRFTFSIRLADMLLRIDEKTLVLAVRYCSGGREMWDNNDGQNYRAVFERRAQHSLTLAGSAVVPTSPDTATERGKGDKAGGRSGGTGGNSSGGAVSDGGKAGSLNLNTYSTLDKVACETSSRQKDGNPLSPTKKVSDLSSRYDLDVSLKNTSLWRPTLEQLNTWTGLGQGCNNVHKRTPMTWPKEKQGARDAGGEPSTAPIGDLFESHDLSFGSRGVAYGSPRDLSRDTLDDSDIERFSRARFATADDVTTPDGTHLPSFHRGVNQFASPPSSFVSSGSEPRVRNHHRSYFDAWASSGDRVSNFGKGKARLTPPGTPDTLVYRTLSNSDDDALALTGTSRPMPMRFEGPPASSPGRCHSFPPLFHAGNGHAAAGLGLLTARPWSGVSQGSGPDADVSEASTPSITSVSSPTTTPSPSSPPNFATLMSPAYINLMESPDSASTKTDSYNAFISSFCFYRGPYGQLETPTYDIRRAHSSSEVEELFSSPSPSSSGAFPLLKGPPPTSSGIDSGSTTPTSSMSPRALIPAAVAPPPTSAGLLETESGTPTRIHC